MPRPVSSEFARRHIGPDAAARDRMLASCGAASLDELLDETIPAHIRRTDPLDLPPALDETAYLAHMRTLAGQQTPMRSMIGLGYAGAVMPAVLRRTVLENPSWYTPYTPYQAEIAQGRLEAMLNFQTMVIDLTGLEVANASLLDEATAAAEAMTMMHRMQRKQRGRAGRTACVAFDTLYPQTIEVLKGRAAPMGIDLRVVPPGGEALDDDVFGLICGAPDEAGAIPDLLPWIEAAADRAIGVAVSADLMALTLLRPPGALGADIVFGSAQRFGLPMGFGGPHAAFFATRKKWVREMPGRIIGVSVDADGRPAYRMALQTREQHIRREKAKSNICTAQALPATLAGFYAVYHGPEGLQRIARTIHERACRLAAGARARGWRLRHDTWFDTLTLDPGPDTPSAEAAADTACRRGINLRLRADGGLGIAVDEATTDADLETVLEALGAPADAPAAAASPLAQDLLRTDDILRHPVFHEHRSETDFMRYVKRLERRDMGLDTAMIPLGSCTMKLNAAAEMEPISWPEFADVHPFAPPEQTRGYRAIVEALERDLAEITGFAAVSLQPNSGAQGEYTGLRVIQAWQEARGEGHRDVVLIPSSAHGTNPASGVMAGLEVVVVGCDERGDIDFEDLQARCEETRDRLCALMITYPSTHGVFEERVQDICGLIHECGGQVYMDGANLNAQVGLTSPARVGADVCHLNLHKTFAIPHGGGGPGMGPIGVAAHLAGFLPGHPLMACGGESAIPPVCGTPWGSGLILLISYGYLRMLGAEGVTDASRVAILNANYIKSRLASTFPILFTNSRGRVAHEMIFDLRPFKASAGVTEEDVAKRLMDYGFHAPTVSWPVPGAMMVEPTESESEAELDRFCDALIAIREEIREIEDGRADAENNLLKNAPHPMVRAAADDWPHPYSRMQAVYPAGGAPADKFWPAAGRVDNPYGDKHLVCSCPPIAAYSGGGNPG